MEPSKEPRRRPVVAGDVERRHRSSSLGATSPFLPEVNLCKANRKPKEDWQVDFCPPRGLRNHRFRLCLHFSHSTGGSTGLLLPQRAGGSTPLWTTGRRWCLVEPSGLDLDSRFWGSVATMKSMGVMLAASTYLTNHPNWVNHCFNGRALVRVEGKWDPQTTNGKEAETMDWLFSELVFKGGPKGEPKSTLGCPPIFDTYLCMLHAWPCACFFI